VKDPNGDDYNRNRQQWWRVLEKVRKPACALTTFESGTFFCPLPKNGVCGVVVLFILYFCVVSSLLLNGARALTGSAPIGRWHFAAS
jgi:hypothetical protein